jgi:hypothetical protein
MRAPAVRSAEPRCGAVPRLAAAATTAMTGCCAAMLWRTGDAPHYVAVLTAVVSVAAVLAASKMWLHNCVESRVAVVTLAGTVAVALLLATSVGRPGGGPRSGTLAWAPLPVLALALALAVPALVAWDVRRRSRNTDQRRPYAL